MPRLLNAFASAEVYDVEGRLVIATLNAIGVAVVTGRKPKAERISEKVKQLMQARALLVETAGARARLACLNIWPLGLDGPHALHPTGVAPRPDCQSAATHRR